MLLNNRYEYNPKTDLLGEGGFGIVFKAFDTIIEKDVAIKMVEGGQANGSLSLVKEVGEIRDLRHENIVGYYDAFFQKDINPHTGREMITEYAVMEYVPDKDLSTIAWNSLSEEQQKGILIGILEGLKYLHRQHQIHRDIKPANILLKKDGTRYIPKISDFGIAKERGDSSAELSKVIGALPYIAPEHFSSKRIDFNADIWSFGVMVFYLFTGIYPFGSEPEITKEQVIQRILTQGDLPSESKKLPANYQKLINICLVKDRSKRSNSVVPLLDILREKEVDKTYLVVGSEKEGRFNTVDTEQRITKIHTLSPLSLKGSEKDSVPEDRGDRGVITDPRDNNEYRWIRVGNQVWMADNLAYLPEVSPAIIGAEDKPHHYVYGFNGERLSIARATDNYKKYGVLYNWEAASQACPVGWHLPSDEEWNVLERSLGMTTADMDREGYRNSGRVGTMLKSKYGWDYERVGLDVIGFNALSAGFYIPRGRFRDIGRSAIFWSSTEAGLTGAWRRLLHYSSIGLERYYSNRKYGLSVRCIQDNSKLRGGGS